MPTINDVARHADVSTATVSRAISQPHMVNEKTRERVQRSIALLGYEPNLAARALRTFRAAKILVTVPDISNPFFSALIQGAEAAARDRGYAVVLGDTRHDPALENQYAAMLRQREVDGLVFLGHRLPEILHPLIEADDKIAPVVNGCEYSPDLGVPSVHIDNAAAGADVVRYLFELGHRRIGVITGPLISPLSRDRLEGVRGAARRYRILRALSVRAGDFSVEAGYAEAVFLLKQSEVTAIFCFSDEMAIGALRAIEEADLSCPADISLIGFDDIRFARYLRPALTTVTQPMAEIGARAVQQLLRILAGETVESSVTLPHHIEIRQSTGPAPAAP